jgi:hypothetical protein
MANVKDIKLDSDQDLFIDPNTGDFAFADSDTQHVKDILNSYAGWWKETPTLGVGVKRYLGSSSSLQQLKRSIKIHLKTDGYKADDISIVGEQIYITGERVLK